MLLLFIINVYFIGARSSPIDATTAEIPKLTAAYLRETRRILHGKEAGDTRPYMVYLRPADDSTDPKWVCGGVIIHEKYILTSAACIEDVHKFYVISGTNKWVSMNDKGNDCVNRGKKRAVWKCVPKSYFFDGEEFNNINWIKNDIAVVRIDDSFNFQKRVVGCDYVPQKINFNNVSASLEAPKTRVSLCGWGTKTRFTDPASTRSPSSNNNSPALMETDSVIVSKKHCRSRWPERYESVIGDSTICTKDVLDAQALSELCQHEVNCNELVYSNEDEEQYQVRRMIPDFNETIVHDTKHTHIDGRRKSDKGPSGGFCENDHGGPLIHGQGKTSIVIGVITACQARDVTKECHGPFLYTSVFANRRLITCAIDKRLDAACAMVLRKNSVETSFDWSLQGPDFEVHTAAVRHKPKPSAAPKRIIPRTATTHRVVPRRTLITVKSKKILV